MAGEVARAPGWHGRLDLRYRVDAGRTVASSEHDGPLRVLKALYPEGGSVCHHVLVHPPGGIVGGDLLDIDVRVDAGAHALITTPGATRFYRSAGARARQSARLAVGDGARLEWLPLEAIAYPGCLAENGVVLDLAPGAEVIGWDVIALGLPASDQPFVRGRFTQQLEWPGVWLERGVIDAADRRLLDSPLGFAGRAVTATLWLASGSPLQTARRDALLAAARADTDAAVLPVGVVPDDGASLLCGASAPDDRLVVLRVLGHRVEPALRQLAAVWACWRQIAWRIDACAPRVWNT